MATSKGLDVAEIIALYEGGRSLRQVAPVLGVRPGTVHYRLERRDVILRPGVMS